MSIYIISNNILSNNNYYKIGMTNGSKKELINRYRTYYGKFTKIIMFIKNESIVNIRTAEQIIFDSLKQYRETQDVREIFICDLKIIKKVIISNTKKEVGNTYKDRLKSLIKKLKIST